MTGDRNYGFGTKALHAGHDPQATSGSRAVPIYQTTSYVFDSAQHAADLFALKEFGNIYTRIMNPTTDVLEQRLAALHGGVGALALASGSAAVSLTVLTLTSTGQNIVSSKALYGGTTNLFNHTLRKMGVETRFVEPDDIEAFERNIDENTRLIYVESIGNPTNSIPDFDALGALAQRTGVPLVVDNTVSPMICNPFDYGAHIVVYSLTKFIGGHGNSIGGAIVDSGEFDWSNGRFPEFTEPDPSYHGMVLWEEFGKHDEAMVPGAAFIMKARLQMLRDTGPCISPFNSFLVLQGLETLHLRMPRHCENALSVARWLDSNPNVSWVNYPGLAGHPSHGHAEKYMASCAGAIIGFGIKGGHSAGVKLIESVKLFSHLANIGDAKSLIIHPASTTHQQLSEEEMADAGISADFIRLSIGIEDIEDIIADLDQAIRASQAK